MYDTIVKAFFILIWLGQFYSVIGLVVWMNKNILHPGLSLRKINTAMTVQIIILAGIVLFFAVDYLYNHLAGSPGGAPSLRYYLLNGAPYLIIPAIFFLVLRKTKKRFLNRPS